jgi:hypothetical protein
MNSICVSWGFRIGLNANQVMSLISVWWSHHGIERKIDRLVSWTLPNAQEAERPYVENYKAERAAKKQKKLEGKTFYRIIAYMSDRESVSSADIERDLGLPHSTVPMQLKRMAAKKLIEKSGRGRYRLLVVDETDCT